MIRLPCLVFLRSKTYFVWLLRNMTHRVFVYGTLKRNEPNHHWLTDPDNGTGKFITEGRTKTKYPLIIATKYNIPFLLYSPGDGYNVKGEIYDVDDKMLGKLDILEDHPNYYIREVDNVVTESGAEEKCWVYFLKKFKKELLKRPQMEDYSSSGKHGLVYMDSEQNASQEDLFDVIDKRNNNESTVDDVEDILK